tara:strand:+ start:992 stop:1390 length:399 start_codon:yes stop_codon:yes gene_type:complete
VKPRYYLATALYCAFIFWMSNQSHPPGAEIDFEGSDKVAHFLVYGVLAGIISIGMHRAPQMHPFWLRLVVPPTFALIFGVSDEIHQLFTPNRTFSAMDMLADGLGAVVAQGLCLYIFRIRPNLMLQEEQGTS